MRLGLVVEELWKDLDAGTTLREWSSVPRAVIAAIYGRKSTEQVVGVSVPK